MTHAFRVSAALRWLGISLLVVFLIATAQAQQIVVRPIQFDGCKDRQGQPVATLVDSQLAAVARLGDEGGRRVIRHNPAVQPNLLPESRLFVFAHECGRQFLGFALDAALNEAQAAQVDCWAVDVLRQSKLIDANGLGAIADDLQHADWNALPGPPRSLQFGNCTSAARTRGSLRIDTGAAPTEKWNACQQGCASKLFSCGRGASCQSAFDQCSAACMR